MNRIISEWVEVPKPLKLEAIWEDPEYCTVYWVYCKNCGSPSPGQGKYKYCPRCGAEMRNGK